MRKILISIVLMTIIMTGLVVAVDVTPDTVPFSLGSWIRHILGTEFSVVGDARGCDDFHNPQGTVTITGGETLSRSASQYCSSGYGLWNVWLGDYAHPYREFRNDVNVFCSASHDTCIFELYCCDEDECSIDTDCASGEECIDISCTSWAGTEGGWKCEGLGGILEDDMPYYTSSYSYCTEAITIGCWYYSGIGSTCTKRIYTGTECPDSYAGHTLFEDKYDCEDTIDVTCEGAGYPSCSVSGAKDCYDENVRKCQSISGYTGLCWNQIEICAYGCLNGVCKSEPEEDCILNGQQNLPGGKPCCSGCQTFLGICRVCEEDCLDAGYECHLGVCHYEYEEIEIPGCLVGSKCCKYVGECSIDALSQCLNQGDCLDAGGDWFDGECHEIEVAEDKEESIECIGEEEIFYTDGEFYTRDVEWHLGWATTSGDVVNPGQLDKRFPGFSKNYRENKATACCEDLKQSLIGEKIREYESGWLFFTGDKGTLKYLQYKCVPEEKVEFCLEFAHLWLNPITKSDNCQQNTIILIVLIVFGFIIISRFAGIYGEFEYEI